MLVQAGLVAVPAVRLYASSRRRVIEAARRSWNLFAGWVRAITADLLTLPLLTVSAVAREVRRVDLGTAIKTLVRVHGAQMLLDGVYNAECAAIALNDPTRSCSTPILQLTCVGGLLCEPQPTPGERHRSRRLQVGADRLRDGGAALGRGAWQDQ